MTTLHKLFARTHIRYTRSPHFNDLADFATWLLEHAYRPRYAQNLVFGTMRALDRFGLPIAGTWTSEQLDRAFRPFRRHQRYRAARHTFGVFLQSVGRFGLPPSNPGPHTPTFEAYRDYLTGVRGLLPVTVAQHLSEVYALALHALPTGKSLKHLSALAIEQYIKQRARGLSRRSLRTSIGCLRAFLRYCHDFNLIEARLDLLDQPVGFRDERPPRALNWNLIQRLLRSIDRNDRSGWRDFMMLHLMAHYGLRPGEITRLTVDSIHWEDRSLLVEQPKTRSWLTLPLLDVTLDLLQRYLKERQRQTQRAELFSTARAPYRPVSNGAINQAFKNRAHKAGLSISDASPYSLRHSFAMRLFGRGVGIKAIGDLMGHSSLVSTFVYLRIQTETLREVALPVPPTAACPGGAA